MKYISHHVSQNAHLIMNSGEMASKQAAKMHGRLIQGQESMATEKEDELFHSGDSIWDEVTERKRQKVTTKDQ